MSAHLGAMALQLLRREGDTVAATDALAGKRYVLVYFSAHWCPPCRSFTPALSRFYATHKDRLDFEIIFVSRDNTAEEMQAYFTAAHGDWLALSFRDAQTIGMEWAHRCGLYAIPSLVVFENTEPQKLVTSYGRDMILQDPEALQFPWPNADAIMIAARRAFMWKAAIVVVGSIIVLSFLIQ